jgi:DNA-directed RNA polymerase subunit RPC12/RpoP
MAYQCPDCGGEMHATAFLTPPSYTEAECWECGAKYRLVESGSKLLPLPRNYEKVAPAAPEATP